MKSYWHFEVYFVHAVEFNFVVVDKITVSDHLAQHKECINLCRTLLLKEKYR